MQVWDHARESLQGEQAGRHTGEATKQAAYLAHDLQSTLRWKGKEQG